VAAMGVDAAPEPDSLTDNDRERELAGWLDGNARPTRLPPSVLVGPDPVATPRRDCPTGKPLGDRPPVATELREILSFVHHDNAVWVLQHPRGSAATLRLR
jgi:hypothetical protein